MFVVTLLHGNTVSIFTSSYLVYSMALLNALKIEREGENDSQLEERESVTEKDNSL